jgi:hypothetical protein
MQEFGWYNSSANNGDANLNSGAYTFRPNGSYALPPSGPITLMVAAQASSAGSLPAALLAYAWLHAHAGTCSERGLAGL